MSNLSLFPEQSAAPPGFVAIPLSELSDRIGPRRNENRCHWCDWRSVCCEWKTEYAIDPRYHCMSYAREDSLNVVFRRDV